MAVAYCLVTGLLAFAALTLSTHAAIPRLTVIDGSFAPDMSGFEAYSLRAAIQDDGKIIVAGESNGVSSILRLNPDGLPDASFKFDPVFHPTDPAILKSEFVSLQVQPDGKLLARSGAIRFDRYGNAEELPVLPSEKV